MRNDSDGRPAADQTGPESHGAARPSGTGRRHFHAVRGREDLTAATVARRAGVEDDPRAAATAATLLAGLQLESRAYAARLRQIAPYYVERLDEGYGADTAEIAVATALRTTTFRAGSLLRDAHQATERLPRTLARLEAGDLPVEWFQRTIRAVAGLEDEAADLVDQYVSGWDLAAIPVARFRRELRLLLAFVDSEIASPPPPTAEQCRGVDVELRDAQQGIAALSVVGPIPEIMALSRRLDASALAVQQAQRASLRDGTEIPFDDEGVAAERKRPLSLAALRYAILTGSVLETGGVPVPKDWFRVVVTVPVQTLMGSSDAPAVLDGETPVPADMARTLAGNEETWYRMLVDPPGRFLPVPLDRYSPSSAMRDHLHVRHPVCAAPGCVRPTVLASEADHIEEFDHEDPSRGGRTSIENLHLLCWRHHQLKTARLIDPTRDGPDADATIWTLEAPQHSSPPPRTDAPPGTSPPSGVTPSGGAAPPRPLAVRVTVPDPRDLISALFAQSLDSAWQSYRARSALEAKRREADRRRAQEQAQDDAHRARSDGDPGPLSSEEPPPF